MLLRGVSRVMAVSRRRRRRRQASIGVSALVFALLPNMIGFQDLGALLVCQPGVAARAQRHVIASPFGTIHAAMFSMPSPLGTGIPHPPIYALANFDPSEITGSIASQFLGDPSGPLQFPTVNRKSKRDSALARPREPLPPLPPLLSIEPIPQTEADAPPKSGEASRFDPYPEYEFARLPDEQLTSPDNDRVSTDIPSDAAAPAHAGKNEDRIYFGADPLPGVQEPIVPWALGEAPVVMAVSY